MDAEVTKKENKNILYQSTTLCRKGNIDEAIYHEAKFGAKDTNTYKTFSTA